MPMWLLTCYIQMLPRLQAEEQLRQVDALTTASPYAEKHSRDRAIRRLRRIANGGDPPVTGRRVSEMTPAQERVAFAQLGLTVVTVTPN